MDDQVDTKVLTPANVWEDKEAFHVRERQSKEEWDTMTESNREAILRIIERNLDRLRDTVDVWVPFSLEASSGSCLDVKFRMMFTDIADEVTRSEFVTQRSIKEAAVKTQRLLDELEHD